jgi:hypothetical protein
MFDGALNNFPRINSTGVQRPCEKVFNLDNAILGIKEHNFEDFFFQVSHRMVQVIEDLAGRPAVWFIEDLFLKKLPGYLLHKFDDKDVGWAYSLNLQQFLGRSFENASQGLEPVYGFFGLRFTITARRPQCQQQFHDFVVEEPRQPRLIEPFP